LFEYLIPHAKKYSFHGLSERILRRIYSQKYIYKTKQEISQTKLFLQNNQIDLVHAHFGPGGLYMIQECRDLGIPLLVTFHGYDVSRLIRLKSYVNEIKRMFIYPKIHGIVVSQFTKNKLVQLGIPPDKLTIWHCGIDVDHFNYVPKRPKTSGLHFIQVSNFVEKKGHKYTIEAFRQYVKFDPESKLILVGDGPLLPDMKALALQLHLNNHIEFKGYANHQKIIQLMKKADVFVHHSVTDSNGDEEGIPNAIMEAMATGLPIISTKHAGIPELVRQNIDGILVPERDIESYLQAMLKMKKNLVTFGGMKSRQQIMENFNLYKQSEKLLYLYSKMNKENK